MTRKRWIKQRPAHLPVVHHPTLTPKEIERVTRPTALDRRFRPVDWHLKRWAVSQGSGLPIDAVSADSLPAARPPPLSDHEAVVTDQVILHSTPDIRRLVFAWYRSPKPKEVIAQELDVSERAVYYEHKLALAYLLGRLTQAGIHIPLWRTDT